MDVAFKRVEPGDDVPPPPKELTEWAGNTAAGTFGGMCYGAFRARYTDPTSYADVPEIVAKRHRFMRAATEATMGGLRLGSFVAVFSAVQLGTESYRGGVRDMWNTVAAGTITAGATGLALPGGLAIRLQGLGLGLVVGAGMCIPLGYAMQEVDKLNAEVATEAAAAAEAAGDVPVNAEATGAPRPPRDLTADVISSVERELRESGGGGGDRKKWRWFGWFRHGSSSS